MDPNIRKWGVLVGTGIASIIIALDFTIVVTALSTLEAYFSTKMATLQWIVTAFGITFTSLLTPAGRLGDTYGRRLFLYIGIIGFGICSVGAGLSQSIWQLIVFRALQGFFGSVSFPIGIALVASAFPKAEQGRAIGIYGGLLGIGLALGPFVGGVILTLASWRWLFFINVPVVLTSLILCLIFVRESKAKEHVPVDWAGLLFLIVGLGSLVFGITGGPLYGWISLWTIVPFFLFIISAALFIWSESKNPFPLLPLDLIRKKGYLLGALVFIICISFAWPMSFFVPLYLQDVLDYDPGPAGLIFLAMTAMTAIGSPLGGYLLDKKGPRFIIALIFIAIVLSYAFQLFFTITGPLWLIFPAFILFGFSWGAGNGIGTPLALQHLEKTEDAGTISGSLLTILNVGGVISLAIATSIFHYGEKLALPKKMQHLNIRLTNEEMETIRPLLSAPETAITFFKKFGGKFQDIVLAFREAFLSGYHLIMAVLFVLSLLAFLGIWLILSEKKRTRKN